MKTMFSSISPTYDLLNHVLSLGCDVGWRRKAVALIDCPTNQSLRVLDLCAGTGDFALAVQKKFPLAKIEVVDFSPEMLELARHKFEKHGLSQVKIICADALKLPFDDGSFDVVVCGFGVRNFADVPKGLGEVYRVLKQGGQVIVLDLFKPETGVGRLFYNTYGRFVLPLVGRLISRHEGAYDYLRNSVQGFVSVGEFEKLVMKIGFASVRSRHFLFRAASVVCVNKN